MIAVTAFVFIFGLLVGSFLNVVIHRVPLGKSVVTPRSKCTSCDHQIKWYENIPVISWMILKGKCSQCDARINWRYPLVELTVGLFAVLLFPTDLNLLQITHTDIVKFLVEFSIACSFLAHFLIDIEHQLLPDKINLYLLAVIAPYTIITNPVGHWLAGGLLGFMGPYLVTLAFYKLKGQIGLGGGDIKLFGILGLLLGPVGVMNTIFMSSMLGSIAGIALIAIKKMNKNTALAFGPYIIVVATVQIFFPDFFQMINPFSLN